LKQIDYHYYQLELHWSWYYWLLQMSYWLHR
jgi:hypothetical protein